MIDTTADALLYTQWIYFVIGFYVWYELSRINKAMVKLDRDNVFG